MLILPRVLRLDFLQSPAMAEAFVGSLKPEDIIFNIELLTGQVFNPATDLLILDEIGECPRAVTALKYFAEQAPEMYVAASGSNIGLLTAFPVGKVEQHNLRPLTFHEFLLASNEATVVKAYENRTNTAAAVSKIHQDLVQGYQRDFGKYAGKADSTLIESVFRNIPAQLSLVLDDSVKRFKFKGVSERKSRYSDFDSAIAWLAKCRLVLKNYPIEGMPRSPLAAYQKENYFKLFLFDIGLLNNMLGISYKEIKQQGC